MAIRRVNDPQTGEWFDMDDGQDDDDGPGTPAPAAKGPAEYAAERKERRNSNAETIRAKDKEIAFLKAGLDPDSSPLKSDFFKAYDGELTVAAVKAAAEARGFVEVPDTPQTSQSQSPIQPGDTGRAPSPEEMAYMQSQAAGRIASASQGADSAYVNDMQRLQQAALNGDQAAMTEVLRQAGVPILHDGTPT